MYEAFVGREIELDNEIITITEYITKGGNSIVFGCKYLERDYVIKFFKGKNKGRYDRFKSEVDKINYLNNNIQNYSPQVIKKNFPKYNYRLFNTTQVENLPFYVMERGEMYEYSNLNFEQKLNDIIEICNSLNSMHSINCIHRDIKPENIVRYNGKLTFIDYGTAHVPGIDTINNKEQMGSRGTIAPEMVDRINGQNDNENKYSDIYSFGKTMWILLTNDRAAYKFTTYDSNNINSKIRLNDVNKGIVMALERIIARATRENYLERIELNKMLELLILIRDGLLKNDRNCNIMKFKCLLEDTVDIYYDATLIDNENKIIEYIKQIKDLGCILSLKVDKRNLCDEVELESFDIEYEPSGKYYYFILNAKKFIFKIKEIVINKDNICIKCNEMSEPILTENSTFFRDIDPFSKKSILSNPIDDIAENVYLECDVCLNVVE